MIFKIVFFTVFLPLCSAIVALGVGLRKNGEHTSRGSISVGFGAVFAFLAVYFWIHGLPNIPLVGSRGWLFLVAIDVAALAVLEALVKKPWVIWSARFVLIGLGLRMILDAKFQLGWSAEQGYIHVVALTVLGLAQWGSLEHLSRRSGGPAFGLAVAAYAGFTAVILGLASSATLAHMMAALALAAFATAVASWRFKALPFAALVSGVVPLMLMLVVMSRVFADLPNTPFLLIAIVPFLVWLGELGPWRKNLFARTVAHFVAIGVPLSLAVSMITTPAATSGESDDNPYVIEGNDQAYDPYSIGRD